jgi:hypothetical protein
VVAHEYTHVAQDQHFGLDILTRDTVAAAGDNSDVRLGLLALVEGDADHSARAWADEYLGSGAWGELTSYEDQVIEQSHLPALWQAQLTFPYQAGERFVDGFYQDGGWAEVNTLYGRPPASTEQVLHPDKYLANEPPLRVVPPPDSGVAGRGWHTLREDTLGELGLRAALEPFLGPERAAAGVEGWGGDSYLLVGLDEQHPRGLVVDTVWDSPAAAQNFSSALADSLDARFAPGGRRAVGLSYWTWAGSAYHASVQRSGEWVRLGIAPDAGALRDLAPPLS